MAEYHSQRLATLTRFDFDQYGYITVKNLIDLARNLPCNTVKVKECIAELNRQGLTEARRPPRK